MTPFAVGLDLVDVSRVERMLERNGDRLLARVLYPDEQTYCRSQASPAAHVAARIAAKEAAFKALSHAGCADGVVWWRDVEVVRERTGSPALRLHGPARSRASDVGVTRALLSITHTGTHAAAVVILVR